MLEIQNVSKTFNAGTVNEKTALNGLNLKGRFELGIGHVLACLLEHLQVERVRKLDLVSIQVEMDKLGHPRPYLY